MNGNISQALKGLENILGRKYIEVDQDNLRKMSSNTLGLKRQIFAVVYPESTCQVKELVEIANMCRVTLYPISRGKNIGYGEKLPVSDGQIIVDLKRMNRIREFDDVLGYVVLEPGVTQSQLFEFLNQEQALFWPDATGAGLESSIVGNTLEGGFGHTPKGNRRAQVSDIEIVLGNGSVLNTGSFPGLGPDLTGAFIQSNYGIVTSLKMELMPIPERFETFIISIQDNSGLEPLVETLRPLRQQGVLSSLVHIANATRYLVSTQRCPEEYKDRLLSCEEAAIIMSSSLVKVGYWGATGGIYGSSQEVKARKKEIKKAFNGLGAVTFFNDEKINSIIRIAGNPLLRRTRLASMLSKRVRSYKHIHGLMKGVPSDEPLNNIQWRVDNYDDMGLIWYSPTVEAKGDDVRKVVATSEGLYEKYGFEMPITLTLVEPGQVIGILSISFNKNNAEEKERAYELYNSLKCEFSENDIEPYRAGIIGMKEIRYRHEGKNKMFKELKRTFDPNNIIAPGRYGM